MTLNFDIVVIGEDRVLVCDNRVIVNTHRYLTLEQPTQILHYRIDERIFWITTFFKCVIDHQLYLSTF